MSGDKVTIQIGSGGKMKRWSTVKYSTIEGMPDAICIRAKNKDGANTMTMLPVPKKEDLRMGRLGRIVWFYCLKICVYLKII